MDIKKSGGYKMKTKVEFTVVENVEKQIKDLGLSEDEIKEYRDKKDEVFKDYIGRLEKSIRNELEIEGYTVIEDFKAIKVEE